MAWGRVCELSVGEGGEGVLINRLDMEFEVQKSMKLSENFSRFVIYNAAMSTQNDMLKQGNNVIFSVGYDDEGTTTVFIGQITESVSKKIGPDWVTEIRAVSSRGKSKTINTIPLTLSYAEGTILVTVINNLAATLGLVVNGKENANIKLPNGWVYQGTTNGALRYIQDILRNEGKDLYFNDDELVIYNIGVASKFEVVYLSYSGGLISVEDVTKPPKKSESKNNRGKIPETRKRIRFETLLVPQMQLNAPITISGSNQDGTYIVEELTFYGDNFGGDFNCKGEATL